MTENERRAKATHEAVIRFARVTAQLATGKRAQQAAARLVELEASYAAKYG